MVVGALDSAECGPAINIAGLPESVRLGRYSYIMMPRLENDTLLAFLMRAIHNNGQRPWRKLSMRLQRYLSRQVCLAVA
jgi:hypothetical protein